MNPDPTILGELARNRGTDDIAAAGRFRLGRRKDRDSTGHRPRRTVPRSTG